MRWAKSTAAASVGLVLVVFASSARGDCGSIPFKRQVQIFEPIQRAWIAWNGSEEILVLSTDLRASKATKVLEVLPLPAKPVVTASDVRIFQKAVQLINQKLRHLALDHNSSAALFAADGRPGRPKPPAGEVVFHERIGPTDVSITHVLNREAFVAWVEEYLKAQKAEAPEIPEPMKKVVGEYLADGYEWFVFNVVSLGVATRTKQALQYRFKSDCIYYPLRITRTETGETSVQLLVLTRELVDENTFTGLSRTQVERLHAPVTLTWQELQRLHMPSARLLNWPTTAKLRIWEVRGELPSFQKDLLAGKPHLFWLRRGTQGRAYGPFPYVQDAQVQTDDGLFHLKPEADEGLSGRLEFRLARAQSARAYGPFAFEHGRRILLGRRLYTVLRELPPAPAKGG